MTDHHAEPPEPQWACPHCGSVTAYDERDIERHRKACRIQRFRRDIREDEARGTHPSNGVVGGKVER